MGSLEPSCQSRHYMAGDRTPSLPWLGQRRNKLPHAIERSGADLRAELDEGSDNVTSTVSLLHTPFLKQVLPFVST